MRGLPSLDAIRAEVVAAVDRGDVIAACRLSQAVTLIETADAMKTKAAELLATASTAGSPVGRATHEP